MESGIDFLDATVSLDGFGTLRMGANKLLKDRTRHGGLLKFKMGIANFEERSWDFVAGWIKGEHPFKLVNGFLKTPLPIVAFAQPILAIRR